MDLFEHYETLPKEVQAILDKYCMGENTYENCDKLIAELKPLGYTCDYGLDGEPHGLRKLSKFDEWSVAKIEKVFKALLDEMSNDEAENLKKEVVTTEEKICYFIKEEKRFEDSFK